MATLPEPFVASDTDVRDLDGFMLNVERLLASELWALSTGEEFKAAVALWCRAWKQFPAGSLPDDERVLAAFAGVKNWKKVREMALRGFVKCSDGRLYHQVLCEDVKRAAVKKAERRERTKAATEARKRNRNGYRDDERYVQRDVAETPNVTTSQGQGQGQGQGQKKERAAADSVDEAARLEPEPEPDPAPPPKPPDRGPAAAAAEDPAIAVIRLFDDCRAEAFGEAQRRAWPSPKDLPEARAILVDASSDMALIRATFAAVFGRQHAAGKQPANALGYMRQAVLDAATPATIPAFLDRRNRAAEPEAADQPIWGKALTAANRKGHTDAAADIERLLKAKDFDAATERAKQYLDRSAA